MGVAAIEAHDLRTGLAHYEAALALDSTDYAANWRAAFALLDEGELIPDSLGGSERDSLFARAEALALRAVAADSTGPEGHFAVAATVGRARSHGQAGADPPGEGRPRGGPPHHGPGPHHDGAYHVLGRWNAEVMRLSGFSRFFAKKFLGAGIFGEASWDQAIANLQKAVELDPGRIYHRLELARDLRRSQALPGGARPAGADLVPAGPGDTRSALPGAGMELQRRIGDQNVMSSDEPGRAGPCNLARAGMTASASCNLAARKRQAAHP